jgi:hypothetical protein
MESDFALRPGDTLVSVQISPCVGGLLRTWADGEQSRLWSVPDAEWLRATQGTGRIGRTLRAKGRFREAATLAADGGVLLVQPRFPVRAADGTLTMEAQPVRLEAAAQPAATTLDEFHRLLAQAIEHCANKDELLLVERGGWDAPDEPFCLFGVVPRGDGFVSVVETAPSPHGSDLWDPHIYLGSKTHAISAPASPETIRAAPILMIDAIRRWGLEPWDLALTFAPR